MKHLLWGNKCRTARDVSPLGAAARLDETLRVLQHSQNTSNSNVICGSLGALGAFEEGERKRQTMHTVHEEMPHMQSDSLRKGDVHRLAVIFKVMGYSVHDATEG